MIKTTLSTSNGITKLYIETTVIRLGRCEVEMRLDGDMTPYEAKVIGLQLMLMAEAELEKKRLDSLDDMR